MDIVNYMEENGHESLTFHVDRESGLKAIIACHSTVLGPAMGPPTMALFDSETDAMMHALRFSYNHTWKCALANLPYGGGRIVVMGDPATDKTEALVRSLGRFVKAMAGRYVMTGSGAGFDENDTEIFLKETSHIIGLPSRLGGSGDSAHMAGYGVYHGMKACAAEVFGSESLTGKIVAISGMGGVGSALAQYLNQEGARLIIADPNPKAIEKARRQFNVEIVRPEEIFDVECDIFSPCSRSNLLNRETIARLRCKIVAGAANNQLADGLAGADHLHRRGILLAPEFVINAGGMINFHSESGGYQVELARQRTENIKNVLKSIFEIARRESRTPTRVAYALAKQKVETARGEKRPSNR